MKSGRTNVPIKLGGSSRGVTAFVPLHGLLFLLCELHMKTPEEILDKVLQKGGNGNSERDACNKPFVLLLQSEILVAT